MQNSKQNTKRFRTFGKKLTVLLWRFPRPLEVGQEIVFEDMIHYTTVKTTMFNGIMHPSIVLEHEDGTRETLRTYTYEDYRDRMD